ncbi:TlpA family protein disulfide reductase [Deferrisoma palaeochoriense]
MDRAPRETLRNAVQRLLALLAVLAVALWGSPAHPGAPRPTDGTVRVGDMAPDFRLTTFDGAPLCLTDCLNGGKPVLLVFWSYFCFPCQKELPAIAELARSLGDRVRVVGICLDGPQYDNKILPFIEANRITFPNGYDRQTQRFFEVAERYGVVGTPTLYLVDATGRIRFIHLGRIPTDVLEKVIESAQDPSFCAEILPPKAE